MSRDDQAWDSRSSSEADLESPFLRQALFVGETDVGSEARLASLEGRTPFLHAFAPESRQANPESELRDGEVESLEEELEAFEPSQEIAADELRRRIVELAQAERKRWREGRLKDTSTDGIAILGEYYRNCGVKQKTSDRLNDPLWHCRNPWSAVFISWVLCKVGVGARFQYSRSHQKYIIEAKKNRDNPGRKADLFKAFARTELSPDVGDLICTDRPCEECKACSGATFDNIDKPRDDPKRRCTHCDIVTEVRRDQQQLVVIGGNVADSVFQRIVQTDAQGRPLEDQPEYGYCKVFAVLKLQDSSIGPSSFGRELAHSGFEPQAASFEEEHERGLEAEHPSAMGESGSPEFSEPIGARQIESEVDARQELLEDEEGEHAFESEEEESADHLGQPLEVSPGIIHEVREPLLVFSIPFAPLPAVGSFWPVTTSRKEDRLVSYKYREPNGIVGRSGRMFLADRTGTRNGKKKVPRWHVGVDLFANVGDPVLSCEAGKIVEFEEFYPANSGQMTYRLLIEHPAVVVNYGEVTEDSLERNGLAVNRPVAAGQRIGSVSTTSMLHFETYTKGTRTSHRWWKDREPPRQLLNPTNYLLFLRAYGFPQAYGFQKPSGRPEIDLPRAVRLNRTYREQLGWKEHIDGIVRVLGFTDRTPGEQDFAYAVAAWQQSQGLTADGVIGPDTWDVLKSRLDASAEKTEAAIKAVSTPGTPAKKASFPYVKDFSGPAAECTDALKRAGKTRAEALTIINAQIGVAIAMLRKAVTDLKRDSRSSKTKGLFHKIFRVKPDFVPTWLRPTATIKDRGDVVATRCKRVADLLASGKLKFFCTINSTNCPDCSNDPSRFACSSWGDESKAPGKSNVVCLGNAFWDDMKAGKTNSLLATLMHEPFHIYYGKYVTEHYPNPSRGKFGGINCIVQFTFETNGRVAPDRVNERCANMVVKKELGEFLS